MSETAIRCICGSFGFQISIGDTATFLRCAVCKRIRNLSDVLCNHGVLMSTEDEQALKLAPEIAS